MLDIIAQILEHKGRDVWCISPNAMIFDALKMMAEKHVGALVVLDEGRVVGVFSERDYALKVALCGLSSRTAAVSQAMTEYVCYITPQTSIDEAMAIVTESRCRHLPVMEEGRLVGLVSIGDLVKATLNEKEFVITQLRKYITGEP